MYKVYLTFSSSTVTKASTITGTLFFFPGSLEVSKGANNGPLHLDRFGSPTASHYSQLFVGAPGPRHATAKASSSVAAAYQYTTAEGS